MKTHCSALVVAGLSLAFVSPVLASKAEDEFKRMDTNADGRVTSVEYATYAEMKFKQSDADHDGRVSAAEAESAHAEHGKKIDKNATSQYMRLVDSDGDGQINRSESDAYAKASFARADKNGDGVLTEDEVEDAHKAMKKQLKD